MGLWSALHFSSAASSSATWFVGFGNMKYVARESKTTFAAANTKAVVRVRNVFA